MSGAKQFSNSYNDISGATYFSNCYSDTRVARYLEIDTMISVARHISVIATLLHGQRDTVL